MKKTISIMEKNVGVNIAFDRLSVLFLAKLNDTSFLLLLLFYCHLLMKEIVFFLRLVLQGFNRSNGLFMQNSALVGGVKKTRQKHC